MPVSVVAAGTVAAISQRADSSITDDRPAAAATPLRLQRVRSKIDLAGQADFEAYVLPKARTIPPYKSWIYLMRNELASETGRRMFYTDKTGMCCSTGVSDMSWTCPM